VTSIVGCLRGWRSITMRTQHFALVVGFVAALLSVVVLSASQDATRTGECALASVGPDVTFMDGIGPPATLKEMFQASALVAQIKILTKGPATPDSSAHPLVVHLDIAEVLVTFKDDRAQAEGSTGMGSATGGRLHLKQYGGRVVIGGKSVATACPAPLLEPNAEAVVFLHSSQDGEYVTAWGSGGLFIIDVAAGTVVVPSSVTYHVAEFVNKRTVPLDELLGTLRTIRDKRP
jgi:hypothetical protein